MAPDDPQPPPPAPATDTAPATPWRRWWARWLAWWRGPTTAPDGHAPAAGRAAQGLLAQALQQRRRPALPPAPPSDEQRARDLIAAIDAGGLPLNPARVNDIARRLGLEVSSTAPMDQTVARIRALLQR